MAKRPNQKILRALADLAKALQRIDAPSMVIGGIAVIAHGVARQTIDIDATILATRLDVSQVLAALRAVEADFAGIRIPVAVPEDLVIYKALAWRDQDRYDIEQLLTLHGDRIDLERVRAYVREFAQILGAPERIAEFDQLVRKVLG